jgi:hypothetical protein
MIDQQNVFGECIKTAPKDKAATRDTMCPAS